MKIKLQISGLQSTIRTHKIRVNFQKNNTHEIELFINSAPPVDLREGVSSYFKQKNLDIRRKYWQIVQVISFNKNKGSKNNKSQQLDQELKYKTQDCRRANPWFFQVLGVYRSPNAHPNSCQGFVFPQFSIFFQTYFQTSPSHSDPKNHLCEYSRTTSNWNAAGLRLVFLFVSFCFVEE